MAQKRGFSEEDPLSTTATSSESSSSGVCTVVGGGRIGIILASKGDTILFKRGDAIHPKGSGPILLATCNEGLDSIVD